MPLVQKYFDYAKIFELCKNYQSASYAQIF